MTTCAERNQRPHHVYDIRGPRGLPLYVGCSGNLKWRLADHARSQPWWPEVVDIRTRTYPSRDLALAAERALIEELQPLHNEQFTERGHWRRQHRIAARAAMREAAGAFEAAS